MIVGALTACTENANVQMTAIANSNAKQNIKENNYIDGILGTDIHPTNPIVKKLGCCAICNLCIQSKANNV